MLTVKIEGEEKWDEEAEKFCYDDPTILQFEHSLVSLHRWESRYHKRFLTDEKKTDEEMMGYVRAMLITPDVSDEVLNSMSEENVLAIDAYINNPMTGTTISEHVDQAARSSEKLSAELIYFWMSQFQIDKECENWHLNQLFTLIRVHHAKTQKPKKISKQKQAQSMAEENARRRKMLGTSG